MREGWRAICVVAVVAAGAAGATAQETPEKLSDFEVHQYVASAGFSPASLMELDSNDEILLACREPRTREELMTANIEFIESQIVLLRSMRMLKLEGDRLETLVPRLDGEDAARVRSAAAAAVPDLLAGMREEVEQIRDELAAEGFGDHAYAVIFSYILDGMVWDFFEEYKEVLPRKISVSRPHWAGVLWGIHPPRAFSTTTRSVSGSDLFFKIGRSSPEAAALTEVAEDWRDLREALRKIAAGELAADQELHAKLRGWKLVDEAGEPAVPVIVEKPGRTIFEIAQRLTERLVADVLEKIDLEGLGEELGMARREQTLVVTYHEVMWDLMEAMEREGILERPLVFADPDGAESADVAAAVFVVDRRRPRPDRFDEAQEVEVDVEE